MQNECHLWRYVVTDLTLTLEGLTAISFSRRTLICLVTR